MKEEKVSIKQRREEPLATVEERETRAVLVAVIRDSQNPATAVEYLDELEFLAETANIRSVKRFTQRLPQPLSKIYVGPGKLEEIAEWCKENDCFCSFISIEPLIGEYRRSYFREMLRDWGKY
mgnify:CR=1 FL=1